MLEEGRLAALLAKRYAGWSEGLGRELLGGRRSLADLADHVAAAETDPKPRPGRRERLESLAQGYL